MTTEEQKTLERIIELEGACLFQSLCENCPFKLECLPSFIIDNKEPPSKGLRTKWALSALSSEVLEELL